MIKILCKYNDNVKCQKYIQKKYNANWSYLKNKFNERDEDDDRFDIKENILIFKNMIGGHNEPDIIFYIDDGILTYNFRTKIMKTVKVDYNFSKIMRKEKIKRLMNDED